MSRQMERIFPNIYRYTSIHPDPVRADVLVPFFLVRAGGNLLLPCGDGGGDRPSGDGGHGRR
jgi:hypothetical protein